MRTRGFVLLPRPPRASLVACTVAPACSSSATSDDLSPLLCPKANVAAPKDDASGRAAADLYQEHSLDDDEIRLLAGFVAYVVVAREEGQVDPVFVESGLANHVLSSIGQKYPSQFAACSSTTTQSIRPLDTTLTCASSCYPSASDLSECLGDLSDQLVQTVLPKLPLPQLKSWVTLMTARGGSAKDVASMVVSMKSALPPLEGSKTLLDAVGQGLGVAGAAAAGAAVLGLSVPAGVIFALTAASLLVTTYKCAKEAAPAYRKMQGCRAFKTSSCGRDAGTSSGSECVVDDDCRVLPRCVAGRCVDCTSGSDCINPFKPLCNQKNTCVQCRTTDDCGSTLFSCTPDGFCSSGPLGGGK